LLNLGRTDEGAEKRKRQRQRLNSTGSEGGWPQNPPHNLLRKTEIRVTQSKERSIETGETD
jgi:hypothetical protein